MIERVLEMSPRSITTQYCDSQITLYHPTAPSGPPTDVATALSATTVSVSWQPPALLDQNGVITAYQVVLVDTMDGSRKISSVGGDTLTMLFEGTPL